MKFYETSLEILKSYVCDKCLGRQFSQILTGMTNEERGKHIRNFIAMLIDDKSIDYSLIESSNFYGFKFKQNKDFSLTTPKKCHICNNMLDDLDFFAKKAEVKLKKIEFNNFLVGSKVPSEILQREEKLWEKIGIEYVESIKSEINRELGKKIWKKIRKPVNFKNPEIVVIANFDKKDVEIQINSLYIFGLYQKLVRGIPQCKWGTPGKYKTSIQEIIAKPIMKVTEGKNNAFHGMGREDVDARCLGWRPFVIEIIEPKIRSIDLKEIQRKVNKTKVKIKKLKFSNKFAVRKIKSERGDKTYRLLVKFDKPVEEKDFKKLKELIGTISQRTPARVAHRRADLIRKRLVKQLKHRQINKKKIELTVKTNAGLYIKELVTGDNGRTKPSVSEILNVNAVPKDLDVIKIEIPKDL